MSYPLQSLRGWLRRKEDGIIITHCIPSRVFRSTHGGAISFALSYSPLPAFGPRFNLCKRFNLGIPFLDLPSGKFPRCSWVLQGFGGHREQKKTGETETKDPRTKKKAGLGVSTFRGKAPTYLSTCTENL